jgi:hypothetical protein
VRHRDAAEKIDGDRLCTPLEAAKLAKETSSKKPDATVEARSMTLVLAVIVDATGIPGCVSPALGHEVAA